VSAQADAIRSRRRAFALPGGSHDQLMTTLRWLLPASIGAVAAIMVLVPLSPRGEVSFLLDRKKVALTGDRIDVSHATYRGTDDDGKAFSVTAGRAVQPNPTVPVIGMENLTAQLQLSDGPAKLVAAHGSYDYNKDKVASSDPVTFTAADGYRMVMRHVNIDLASRTASGGDGGGVTGTVPTGSFSANQIVADLDSRTVALQGRARLRMVPGQMKMPK
jgi:lipopolysaccharide export system protein LptC